MSSYTSLRGQFEEGFRYGVATLPFYAILCIVAGVLSLVLCCGVRQQHDPARSYLNWLRCTFGLFVFYSFTRTVSQALYVANMRMYLDSVGYGSSARSIINRASNYIGFVSVLTGTWTEVLLVATLVTVGVCISETRRGVLNSSVKVFRIVTLVVGLVIWVLAIARFALVCRSQTLGNLTALRTVSDVNRIQFSILVLLLVLAVLFWGWSVAIKVQAKNVQKPDSPSTYFLVCTTLFVLETIYDVAIFARYVDLTGAGIAISYDRYVDVLDLVFSFFPMFIILVLLFTISKKRVGGLWSLQGVGHNPNHQPTMAQHVSWGQPQMYPQYQPPPQTLNPGWNQQQFHPGIPPQQGPFLTTAPPQEMHGGHVPTWHEMPQPSYREHAGTKPSG